MKPRYRITILPEGRNGGLSDYTLTQWDANVGDHIMRYDRSGSKQIKCVGYHIIDILRPRRTCPNPDPECGCTDICRFCNRLVN